MQQKYHIFMLNAKYEDRRRSVKLFMFLLSKGWSVQKVLSWYTVVMESLSCLDSVSMSLSAVLHSDRGPSTADRSRLSRAVVDELCMETSGTSDPLFSPPLLRRSGNRKAWSCSTKSAASAWTARARWGLWSSLSVAPRWPASPGSRRSSRERQLRERQQQQNRSLQKDSGCCTLWPRWGSKKSHNCTCVMSPSIYCSPSSPWQESLKR